MKPLVVLLISFLLFVVCYRVFTGSWEYTWPGNLSMAVMLLFTAIGHFKYSEGMRMMIPEQIPFKLEIVYATGIIECMGAVGLCIPSFRVLTAWLLIVFFVCILPANIYAALKHVDYQQGTLAGPGVAYLWFRVPLQVFFIGWIWYFSLYS